MATNTNQLREAAERWKGSQENTFSYVLSKQSIQEGQAFMASDMAAIATYAAEQLTGDGGGKAATIDKAKELHKGPPPNPPKGASQIYG